MPDFSNQEEESLSIQRLKAFKPLIEIQPINRPESSFINLMKWTEENFKQHLTDQKHLTCFVHNSIVIDGQFMQFIETYGNKAEIKIIYKDSIVSWSVVNDYEKFFIQGVSLIKSKGLEFIQAALYHKGNNNEDEISFFVIVSESNYEAYLKFRNDYEFWQFERSHNDMNIHVIGTEPISYDRDCSWDDIFLSETLKTEIQSSVENFLENEEFYRDNGMPWKKGLLFFGPAGCGKTSLIKTIMSEYPFKPVTILPGASGEMVCDAFDYAEDQCPALLYFEDLDSLLDNYVDTSLFLNLMDGVAAKNGLFVIATANDISRLKPALTDRPSRFDRKIEIPLPDLQLSEAYLKKFFGKMVPVKKIRDLAKSAVKSGFSFAYLKEFYISSMFEAVSNKRQIPIDKDLDKMMMVLIADKNIIRPKEITIDKYLKAS